MSKALLQEKISVQAEIKSCYQCSWNEWKMSLFILLKFASAAKIRAHC